MNEPTSSAMPPKASQDVASKASVTVVADVLAPPGGSATGRREGAKGGSMVRRLYDWVLHWAVTPYGAWALAMIAFAEASCFPIPPDVLLIAMSMRAPASAWRYAAYCSVASVFGGLAGYAIGALAWHAVGPWFYAYVPGFTPAAFAKISEQYIAWGIPIVFTAGFSPIPYKLFTIASGVMGLPLIPFLGASAVSRSARFFLVAGLMKKFGQPMERFIDRYFNLLALAFAALVVGGFAAVKLLF